jgi:hypothetical protein
MFLAAILKRLLAGTPGGKFAVVFGAPELVVILRGLVRFIKWAWGTLGAFSGRLGIRQTR